MALKDIFKISRKTFFNPTAWLGYNEVKNQTIDIWNILATLFTAEKPRRVETFEQALKRLKLTKVEVQQIERKYFIYSLFFGGFAVLALLGGIYLLIQHGSFAAFILAIASSSLFLVQAFRYHFWSFQMKNRKLGCTFDEWWQGKIDQSRDD